MIVNEGHQEPMPQRWLRRTARERQKLSASIMEALDDGQVDQVDQVDEEQWQEESSEKMSSVDTTRGAYVIPPRWSIQSRSMSTIYVSPGQDDEAAGDEALLPSLRAEEAMKNVARGRQRLAGRATRVRLQTVSASDTEAPKPTLDSAQVASVFPSEAVLDSWQRVDEVYTEEHLSPVFSQKPLERAPQAVPDTNVQLPAVLAEWMEAKEVDVPSSTGAPAQRDARRDAASMPGLVTGTDAFMFHQRNTSVACAAVTESSVVLVTLTSNPGPVVVQYISLHPGIGFTVHLTAATEAHTPFNYAVLSNGLQLT